MLLRTVLALLCPLVLAGKQGESLLLNPANAATHVTNKLQHGKVKNTHPGPTSTRSYQGLRLHLENSSNSNEEPNVLMNPNETNSLRRLQTDYPTNWYYVEGSEVCSNDGGVATQTDLSLEACCVQYLDNVYGYCMENSTPTPTEDSDEGSTNGSDANVNQGSGGASFDDPVTTVAPKPVFWYPAWALSLSSGEEQYCMYDDVAPSHMSESGLYVFTSQLDCCRKFFNWDVIACLGGDEATPPGFYPDWSSIDESKCLNSIEQIGEENSLPDYMFKNPQAWLLDDIESCCEKYFPWDVRSCIIDSGGTYAVEFSNKWYVDGDEEVCKQDCFEDASSSTCGGPAEVGSLFETPEACCANQLSWVPTSACVQKSRGEAVTGTRKWWTDWCVKDCEDDGDNCGGLGRGTLYEDVDLCCSNLFWVNRTDCI